MSGKIKVLVVASVLLNVLFVGLIMGHLSHRGFGPGHFMKSREKRIVNAFPPEKRKLLIKTFEELRQENRGLRDKIGKGRERTLSILRAPDFNEAAYRAEVEKLHDLRGIQMQKLADAVMKLARQLNPEERRILSELLMRPGPFGEKPHHRLGGSGHPEPPPPGK